jgi:uncharacterized membrane protein
MRQHHYRWLLLFFIVATLLRFALLGAKSLWLDEAFSAWQAGNPVARIITLDRQLIEPHPPLYYMGLHYWTGVLGTSETILRLPSAILSLGSVGLLYLLGSRLFNPTIGLMAAGLLSVAPINIWYAQEARMHASITFLGLLAAVLLTWDRWLALPLLGVTLAVGLYVDYTIIPLWIALSAAWFVWWWHSQREKRPLFIWLLATGTAVILYLPWGSVFLQLLNKVNLFYDIVVLQERIGLPFLSINEVLFLLGLASVGLVAMMAVTWHLLQRPRLGRVLILLGLLFFMLATISFALPRFYTIKRFLVIGWPYIILGVAWGLAQLGKWRIRLWVGLLGLSLLAALVVLFFSPKDDWRNVVDYVDIHVPVGDVIWIDPPHNHYAYTYYTPALQVQSGNAEELVETVFSDVWLIAERFYGQTPPTSQAERIFDLNLELVEAIPFSRLELRHYQPKEY